MLVGRLLACLLVGIWKSRRSLSDFIDRDRDRYVLLCFISNFSLVEENGSTSLTFLFSLTSIGTLPLEMDGMDGMDGWIRFEVLISRATTHSQDK